MKIKEDYDSKFLVGLLFNFFNEDSTLSKTDLKVYFNMYSYSENDNFEFSKYSEVEHLIEVDKFQFSKSIKKLINEKCVVKTDNSYKLLHKPPF